MPHFSPIQNDASSSLNSLSRRRFLQTAAAATALAGVGARYVTAAAATAAAKGSAESLVKMLYDSLGDKQRKQVCFGWDHNDAELGLLRTRISANWHITKPLIQSDFYTADQQRLMRDIFTGLIQPDWVARLDKQLKDDDNGFGRLSAAIFGTPGTDKFEFVLSGRHITLRCDGHTAEHVAFGGPIVYGHAASGFNEKPGHPNNVFWPQAVAANSVFKMLDGRQQKEALIAMPPAEDAIGFKGRSAKIEGISVKELSADQKAHVQSVLAKLIEPYRQSDRDRAVACLKAQGGLDECHLAFFEQGHLRPGEYDIWRLEGPAFIWHFRGVPHVHTWVHVADDPAVKINV
jgi:hypothetical protein